MATYLFTWNPDNYPWPELADAAARCRAEGLVSDRWSCGNTRKIVPGDRFVLLRQATEPRGIVGAGEIARAPYEDAHWEDGDRKAWYVDVSFESLLDPGRDVILPRSRLDDIEPGGMHWDPQSSGTEIPDAVATALDVAWAEHLQRTGYSRRSRPADELDPTALATLREAFLEYHDDFSTFEDTSTGYHREERVYKTELVERFQELLGPERFEGLEDEERLSAVMEGVRSVTSSALPTTGKPQNLLSWRYTAFLREMSQDETRVFAEALGELLYGEGDSPERLAEFNRVVWPIMKRHGQRGQAASRSLPTFFLMLVDPEHDIFVRSNNFAELYRVLGSKHQLRAAIYDAEQYSIARAITRQLRDACEEWGWRPRDMIDVQGFVWVATEKLAERGREARAPKPEPESDETEMEPGESTQTPFDQLLAKLEADGLYFPTELVANYLLALQAKRFVILTGISGTGKTKLAQAVALHFRPRVDVKVSRDLPENAVEKRVYPSSLKYGQIVIPVVLARQLRLPPIDPETNGGSIVMHYPGGQQSLTFWKDPTRDVTNLSFRGAFRAWYQETFEVGDRFLLAIEPASDESEPDAVRMRLPDLVSETRPLDNYEVVAVRPDWTDNRNLVGFYSQLTREYHRTPFLDLLLRARADADAAAAEGREARPYFVVLDEMNLARVEHYFSDFLSCLESGEALQLHSEHLVDPDEEGGDGGAIEIPSKLRIPPNLFITGTVNIDETTYMFSPKVLDRAFAIELNAVNLAALDDQGAMQLGDAPLALRRMPAMPLQLVLNGPSNQRRIPADEWRDFGELLDGDLRTAVVDLHDLLTPHNRHFGYRVAIEMARFVNLAAAQAGEDPETLWAALDLAFLQKVLPKFHGTQQQIEHLLAPLFDFAINGSRSEGSLDARGAWVPGPDGWLVRAKRDGAGDEGGAPLPRAAAKLWRMLDQLQRQGFAAYIE